MTFSQVYDVLFGIFNGWLTSANSMLDFMTTPITDSISKFFDGMGLITVGANSVIFFITETLGLGEITVFGLLGFSFLTIGLILVFVTVILRWVLEFIPG